MGGRGSGSGMSRGGAPAIDLDNDVQLKAAYENINPNFNPDSVKQWDEYQWNCNKCVVAFEANMRGDDVEATPYEFGRDADFSNHPEKAFGLKPRDGWEMGASGNRGRTVANIEEQMADYGVGSRGIITYRYSSTNAGHTLNVIQTSKGTKYIDAQIGKELTATQALKGASLRTVTLYRTDNRPINSDIADRAYRRR